MGVNKKWGPTNFGIYFQTPLNRNNSAEAIVIASLGNTKINELVKFIGSLGGQLSSTLA